MLIDRNSSNVRRAPTMAHTGIALGAGCEILLDTLRSHANLCRTDDEQAFQTIE